MAKTRKDLGPLWGKSAEKPPMTAEQQAQAEAEAFGEMLPMIQRHQDRAMRIFQRFKVSTVTCSVGIMVPVSLSLDLTFERKDSGVACPKESDEQPGADNS